METYGSELQGDALQAGLGFRFAAEAGQQGIEGAEAERRRGGANHIVFSGLRHRHGRGSFGDRRGVRFAARGAFPHRHVDLHLERLFRLQRARRFARHTRGGRFACADFLLFPAGEQVEGDALHGSLAGSVSVIVTGPLDGMLPAFVTVT